MEGKADCKSNDVKINGKGWIQADGETLDKDVGQESFGRQTLKYFAEDATQKASEQDEKKQ